MEQISSWIGETQKLLRHRLKIVLYTGTEYGWNSNTHF